VADAYPPPAPVPDDLVSFESVVGLTDEQWWNFLHKHGIVGGAWVEPRRGRSWTRNGRKVPGWVGALAFWINDAVPLIFRGPGLDEKRLSDEDRGLRREVLLSASERAKIAKRAIRIAKRDENFRRALDASWRLGGDPAVMSFVRGYDWKEARP
jgi:hypothetical protein